MANFINRYQ